MAFDRGMSKQDVIHIKNGILFSHKKNKIMSFKGTWMDLELVISYEVSQTEKDKYHTTLLIYGIYKKSTNELIYKTEIELHM